MGAFSFMSDPTMESGLTPDQFMRDAYDQPFAKSDALLAAGTESLLSSPTLGVAARNLTVPEGRVNIVEKGMANVLPFGLGQAIEPYVRKPMNALLGTNGQETDAQLIARGEQPLTAEQYKASPSYRERVPYDAAMTVNRASVLAEYDDARSVREEMARKAPWWVNTAGGLVGSALDPVNYIPVFGEAAAGASIGARILRGGADAAANVGVAGLLSAPARAQYGDDVSFQSQVSSIAMAAAIGGVFGAAGGILHNRAAASDARAAAVQKDLADRLATIRNGQDSMATLAEAVDHLSNDGEINLGEGSIDRLDALHDQAAEALPQVITRAAETPDAYANRMLAKTMPDEVRTLAQHDAAIAENTQALSDIQTELKDPRFDAVRQADQEARQLDEQHRALSEQMDQARGDQKAELAQQVKAIETRIDDITSRVDTATSDRMGALQRELARRQTDLKAVTKERAPVAAKVEVARQERIAEHATLPPPEPMTAAVPEMSAQPPRPPRALVATKPKPETVQPEAIKAAAAIGKADTPKAIAEQHGVDAETGAIPEDYELAQLAKEGRLEPGSVDAKALDAANENFATAKSWGEALRAAVACLI